MQATFNPNAKTKFTSSHRKEGKCNFTEYAAIVPQPNKYGYYPTPVILRLYYTGETCYCCVWVNAERIHTSGTGRAGGYGYHKGSAAAAEAIINAGITLSERIDGVGEEAINSAVRAIAAMCGFDTVIVHKANQ